MEYMYTDVGANC